MADKQLFYKTHFKQTSSTGCGSVPAGQLCQCKVRVQGRICNDCKSLFWNLQEYNPLGCEGKFSRTPKTFDCWICSYAYRKVMQHKALNILSDFHSVYID